MVELSVALITIASIAGWLINKFLNQRQQVLDRNADINSNAAEAALSAAVTEMHKHFDERINKAFESIQLTKSELEALKLAVGLRGNR